MASGAPRSRRVLTRLTVREAEILRALSRGASYEHVAVRLGISINTVRTHVRAVYDKLGARSKTEAIVIALERGLLAAPGDRDR